MVVIGWPLEAVRIWSVAGLVAGLDAKVDVVLGHLVLSPGQLHIK